MAGMSSCRVMRSRSVVPPMPSEVKPDRAMAGCSSTPSAASSPIVLGSLRRMALRDVVGRVPGAKQDHQLVAGAADASGPDGENGVSGPRVFQQKHDAVLHRADVLDVLMACFTDGRRQGFSGNPGNRRFAGRVDIGDDQQVRLVESPCELLPQMLRAGVAVRLEEHQQTVKFTAACRFERGPDFGGVMAIIVDDRDLADRSFDVKSAAYAGEVGKALANELRRDVEIEGNGGGGSRVADVVDAGRVRQAEKPEIFALVRQPEFTGQAVQLDIADEQIGLAGCAVGQDGALDVRDDGLNVGLV